VICGLLSGAVTNDSLIQLQGHLNLEILSENKCTLLFGFLMESPGDLTKDDIADDLE